jgi:hypothetical protein
VTICVGVFDLAILLRDEDPAEHAAFDELYERLSDELVRNNLQPHREPRSTPEDLEERGEIDCFPASALHALRQVYAHVRRGSEHVPESAPRDDLVLQHEYQRRGRESHLIHFSDAAGFYVPQEFALPFSTESVGDIGSSERLLAELRELSPALDIHLVNGDLSEAVIAELAQRREGHRFAEERVVWFSFFESARKSIRYGTAIRLG